MFKFNSSSFQKGSILLGVTSDRGWLRSAGSGGCSCCPESSP